MTTEDTQAILEKTLSFVTAEHAEVTLSGFHQGATRFANNAITQNLAKTDASLSVRAAFGQQVGSASVNQFDEESLRRVVQRAEDIARHSEPDTEYLPPLEPQTYRDVPAFSQATADCTPEDRAAAVREALSAVSGNGLRSAGSLTTEDSFVAVANSEGLFGFHRRSEAHFVDTVMTEDSSGWAEVVTPDVRAIDESTVARVARQKAEAARNPRAVEPKAYTVILEPAAVAELLSFLAWSLDAKAADEGRSALSGKWGTPIAASDVNLRSEPAHPDCPMYPFFGDGLPTPDVTWIENGVLKNLAYSRFWAQKTGHEVTGWPTNLIMDGGDATLEDMIASVERGLLITRFWYIRHVDPMKLLLTGMTRDGLFWIENGEIQHGVKNLRFNESPLNMLQNVEMRGPVARSGRYLGCLVPALKVRDFRFTSGTTF